MTVVLSMLMVLATTEVFLPLTEFDATEDGALSESTNWTPIRQIEEPPAGPWQHLRTSFTMEATWEEGPWVVRAGQPGVSATARCNGTPLVAVTDPHQGQAELSCAGVYLLPSTLIREGSNTLEFHCPQGDGDRWLKGAAYLLSPWPGSRLLEAVRAPLGDFAIANQGAMANVSSDTRVLSRILFRPSESSPGYRCLGSLDLTLVEKGKESGLEGFATGRLVRSYPSAGIERKDPLRTDFVLSVSASAPASNKQTWFSQARWVQGSIANKKVTEDFEQEFILRLFPHVGGALQLHQEEGFVVLHNERIGLWATGAEVWGSQEQPRGLKLKVTTASSGGDRKSMMAGSRETFAVFAFEGDEALPADDLISWGREAKKKRTGFKRESALYGNSLLTMENPSSEVKAFGTQLRSHLARLAHVHLARQQTSPSAVEDYWQSAVAAIHLNEFERGRIARLEQQVMASAKKQAMDADGALAAAYLVLRGMRAEQWREQPDRSEIRQRLWRTLLDAADSVSPPEEQHHSVVLLAAHAEYLRWFPKERDALQNRVDELAKRVAALFDESGADRNWLPFLAALVLPGVSDEQFWPCIQDWGEADLPSCDSILEEALLVRALLFHGFFERGRGRLLQLQQRMLSREDPFDTSPLMLYETLLHGWAGLELLGDGTIALTPRMRPHDPFQTTVPIPGGKLELALGVPDLQFRRTLRLRNLSSQQLQVRVGVPDLLDESDPVQIGNQAYGVLSFETKSRAIVRRSVR